MGRITAAFRQELGENLTGIYLHGSAAFGSMSEGSDLDIIAVTERPPTQEQKEHLIAALLQLEREAPAKGLEMSVVLLRDCRDFAYPTPYQLHYSPMHRRAFEQDLAGYCRRMQGVDYDLAAHFTVIRRVGIVLFGSLIREVFGPVPFADYLDSICRDVAGAAQDILHTPLDTALNLCRVLAAAQEGLVLSNTCSLSGTMSEEGYRDLKKMIESQRKFKKWLCVLPFSLIKGMMKRALLNMKTDEFTAAEKAAMEEICGAMLELLTKPYEAHMIDFLCDAEHHFGMTRADFAPWAGRVLLILSEDDATFSAACKQDLIDLMPDPTVVTDLTGGHLALMVRLEQYAQLVTGYILERT